jgi:hypothetical protein
MSIEYFQYRSQKELDSLIKNGLLDKSFYEKCKKISEEVLMSPWEFERMMYYVFNNNIK